MNFKFKKMTQQSAMIIADEWKYEGIYSFYDMSADVDDYEEFINETSRNESDFYQACVDGELIGFFCVSKEEDGLDLGLGLKPDYCGQGVGKEFLNQILNFIKQNYDDEKVKMAVATFNERAIKVYHACGFKDDGIFSQQTNGGVYEFLRLVKE